MPRHKCPTCGKHFELKSYLARHSQRMHSEAKKAIEEEEIVPLKCSMCDKVFPRLSHLQRHQMTHLNVRNFSCEFCDEKFVQKSHLTRHVSRKHPESSGLEVTWIACGKCGNLFKTAYELTSHRRSTHHQSQCSRCLEIVEGLEGMRRHQMKCRNESRVCSQCGASFGRPADLISHQNSCLKKVAFVCTPCDVYFKQRVQLDRHINKLHFRSVKCETCENVSESPVHNSRHALECRKIVICGYCNHVEPDANHIAENHWKRFKKAVTVRTAKKKTEEMRTKSQVEEKTDEDLEVDEDDKESEEFHHNSQEYHPEKEKDEHETNDVEEEDLFSTLNFTSSSSAFSEDEPEDYLTFSICPKDTDLSFEFKGKLPTQLVELFPELEETSIVLLNSTSLSKCRMTVQVPVFIAKNSSRESERKEWLQKPIVLQ